MIVGVTGATGHLGRRTVELLLDRLGQPDGPSAVVATTRSPEGAADLARRGAEVRRGDFDEPSTLAAAFAGLDRLLVVSADAPDPQLRIGQHAAAIAAAAAAGVPHLVYTSFVNADRGRPDFIAVVHLAAEEALRQAGPAWTVLRNNLYADQLPQLVGSPTNAGSGRAGWVAREDCAAVAAAVLAAPGDAHAGQVYDVTGPRSLTMAEAAAQLGTGGVTQVDDGDFVRGMVGAGAPEPVARAFAGFGAAQREGIFDVVSDVVPRLVGRAAIPVSQLRAG